MTSVAAVFGALPIALGLGAGAASRRPLGYSIIGGLVVSTLLTLFLVPAVFVVFERLRRTKPAPASTGGTHTPDWTRPQPVSGTATRMQNAEWRIQNAE
jgi:HAE1 family hydrophobic/amphiphilic exporter-1